MDGTREERLYHLQNWRGDVVRLISAASGGRQVEGARFSSYGVPWGIAKCDIDGDGDVDTDDGDFMLAWSGVPASYDVRGDFDLDGDIDINDEIIFNGSYEPALGWGSLSNFASRKGYAGYEHDGNFDVLAHVRNRVYASDLGRWTRRDPAGFVDGLNLYQYTSGMPVTSTDSSGLRRDDLSESDRCERVENQDDPFDGGCPSGNGCDPWLEWDECSDPHVEEQLLKVTVKSPILNQPHCFGGCQAEVKYKCTTTSDCRHKALCADGRTVTLYSFSLFSQSINNITVLGQMGQDQGRCMCFLAFRMCRPITNWYQAPVPVRIDIPMVPVRFPIAPIRLPVPAGAP